MNAQPSNPTQPPLSAWQRRQAAMLYEFASMDYLRGLHLMVSNLLAGMVDPLLDLAKAQNRDSVLADPRWGARDTSANWSNNAWPFLKDLQVSLTKDIAKRALECYGVTGTNEFFRGMDEYSMRWATPDEEQKFNETLHLISTYANKIDETLDDYHNSRWTDSGFANEYKEFAAQHPRIPKFRIRADVVGETGKTPRRTGVYISQDDENAALQFAWTGNGGGKLRPSKTFSAIGLDALQTIGRQDLWLNDQRMFEFATSKKYDAMFRSTIYMLGKEHRNFASPAVARAAFVDRPCEWYFVEIVNGEYEDIDCDMMTPPIMPALKRIPGGKRCPETGFYFTPASPNSRRYFTLGETMPNEQTQYGETYWQWDVTQK